MTHKSLGISLLEFKDHLIFRKLNRISRVRLCNWASLHVLTASSNTTTWGALPLLTYPSPNCHNGRHSSARGNYATVCVYILLGLPFSPVEKSTPKGKSPHFVSGPSTPTSIYDPKARFWSRSMALTSDERQAPSQRGLQGLHEGVHRLLGVAGQVLAIHRLDGPAHLASDPRRFAATSLLLGSLMQLDSVMDFHGPLNPIQPFGRSRYRAFHRISGTNMFFECPYGFPHYMPLTRGSNPFQGWVGQA